MGSLLYVLSIVGATSLVIAAAAEAPQIMNRAPTLLNTTSFPNSTRPPSTAPPIPHITLTSLPPEFNDIPSDSLACYNSWASARATNAFVEEQMRSLGYTITIANYTSTITNTYDYESCDPVPYTRYTTLCDGIARNTELREDVTCTWVNITSTTTWVLDNGLHISTAEPWVSSWSSSNVVPLPSCTPAPDRERVCYRLYSAYDWRTSQAKATLTANATETPDYMFSAERPTCKTLPYTAPANLTTKTCQIGVGDYEIHYWPSAPLPGSSFCANGTRSPGGTRTIPNLPNTAVVSGLTLTSPSVYHFLKGVAVSTSMGKSRRGRYGYVPVYNLSSSIPQAILTLAELESDIWTAQPTKKGRGIRAHWVWKFGNGSYNADAMTKVQLAPYMDACKREVRYDCSNSTISQAQYRQYAAVSIKGILDEWNKNEFGDCEWYQYYEKGKWYDRMDMWIVPGEPWRATPIVTADGGAGREGATGGPKAKPGSIMDSVAVKTAENLLPEVTGTGDLE